MSLTDFRKVMLYLKYSIFNRYCKVKVFLMIALLHASSLCFPIPAAISNTFLYPIIFSEAAALRITASRTQACPVKPVQCKEHALSGFIPVVLHRKQCRTCEINSCFLSQCSPIIVSYFLYIHYNNLSSQ